MMEVMMMMMIMTLDLIDVNEENNQVQTIGYKSETGRIRF